VLYPFLGNQDIWRHDKAQTTGGSDDWFGEAVARPDFVHSDLKEIINPGSVPNHNFKYFRNFSKNGTITTLSASDCKPEDLTCGSYNQQKPLTAGLSAEAPPNVTREQSLAGSTFRSGIVTACIVMLGMV
jgi:hypothetical protein